MSENTENTKLADKLNSSQILLGIVIIIGGAIGNYMLSNYRIGELEGKVEDVINEHDKDIEKIDKRLSSVEKINFELLEEQLIELENNNQSIKKQIDKTNGRMDKIYEILLNK